MREVPLRLGETALTFEPVKFESQQAMLNGLKNRSIDMIFHMNRNPSAAEDNGFLLSDTVLRGPLAAMTAQDYFNENAENRVAIERDNQFLKWHVAYHYPMWTIVEAESFQAAEMSVRAGRADCVLVKSGQLSQYAEELKLHPVFFMKGTGPQRAEPPALKICIKKLLSKGNQSSEKRTIKRSQDLQR